MKEGEGQREGWWQREKRERRNRRGYAELRSRKIHKGWRELCDAKSTLNG